MALYSGIDVQGSKDVLMTAFSLNGLSENSNQSGRLS